DEIKTLSGPIEVKQFPSGFSNLTYQITASNRQLILRRPPFGTKARSAHDMGREFNILKALYNVFPYCPRPYVYTEDESIIGSSFYIMEKISGIILRKNLPQGLSFTPEQAKMLSQSYLDIQHKLHSIDYKSIGLENFGKPEGYVKRQVEGWGKRYTNARTKDAPDFQDVMAWLEKNRPPDCEKPGIIHNDYKLDNVVLDPENPTTIIGVLDWEMATIGDPLMDLGSSLAYWVQKNDSTQMLSMRTLPTHTKGFLTRDELVDRYLEKSGLRIDSFNFYLVFGMFRLAAIAQQIYYRYFNKQTRDKRFAMLILAVRILENEANNIILKS
ncbi:MAG: phosphotransferase family protein, partial [Desulfobacteraceae bacterium]|nr:phosphotransferase family protein [Desulfobacteraceae bacterium]